MRTQNLHPFLSALFLTSIIPAPVQGQSTAAKPSTQTIQLPTNKSAAKPVSPQTISLFDQAITATRTGEIGTAARLYRRLLEKDPTYAPAWANFALLSARNGDYTAAIEDMQKAINLEPKTAAFQAELSSLYFRKQQIPQCLETARKVLLLEPGNRIAGTNLAVALMVTHRYNEAIPILRKLIAQSGQQDDRSLYPNLVYALASTKQPTKAHETALAFAARYPKDPNPQVLLGDLAAQSRKFTIAHQYYTKALLLDPNNAPAALKNALTFEEMGNRETAISLLEARAAAHPTDSGAFYHLGRIVYADTKLPSPGRFVRAERAFRTATTLEPTNSVYFYNLGLAIMFQGPARADDAKKVFQEMLKTFPNNAGAHSGLAYIAETRGDKTEAIAEYRAALLQDPNDYNARRRLAGLLYITQDKTAAYKEFEELAVRHPSDVVALSEVASLYVSDKMPEAAKTAYQTILRRDPKNVGAYLGLGQLLDQEEVTEAARRNYQMAIKIAPRNRNGYLALVALDQRRGFLEEAATTLSRLVQIEPENNLTRWQLAGLYKEVNRDADALREMRAIKPTATDPNRMTYLMGPASLFAERKNYAKAIAELKSLSTALPKETVINYTLAELQAHAGQYADAEATLKAVLQSAPPSDLRPQLTLANFYQLQKRTADAMPLFESSLKLIQARIAANPKDTDAFYLLGIAFEGLSRKNEAIAAYQQAVQLDANSPAITALRRLVTPSAPDTKQANPKNLFNVPTVAPPAKTAKPTESGKKEG